MASLLIVVFLLGFFLWLIRRGDRAEVPRQERGDPSINYTELDEAEREVKDLDSIQRPEDGFPGDDWGRGTPRPPERL